MGGMLTDFARLVSEIFPSIDPRTASRCLAALARTEFNPARLFRPLAFDFLCQGDIVNPIKFVVTDDDGSETEYEGPGLLLSNTCDAHNEEHLIFAGCYHFDQFLSGNICSEASIKSNCIFNFLYLPLQGEEGRGLVADLSLVQSHSRVFIEKRLLASVTKKLCSLSECGFYLLLAKITIHLLRPETQDVIEMRREAIGGLS